MSLARPDFELPRHDGFFIGGQWSAPSSSQLVDVVNPSTEDVFFRVPLAQPADSERAVAAAREAFDHGPWPRLSHQARAQYLRAIGDGIRRRLEQFGATQVSQMGIVYQGSLHHTSFAAGLFDYYADLAEDFPFVERHSRQDGGELGLLVREPMGVVGSVVPWNGPISLIASKMAPALLAGCTYVLKVSPEGPGEALLVAEVAEEVGVPAGVVNVIVAGKEATQALVGDGRVDKVFYTGSTTVGRQVAAQLSDRVGRAGYELGGKSAAIILDDYDLQGAAATLAEGGAWMAGQSCSALTRIIVPRSRHDDFVDALSAAYSSTKVGDPFDPGTQMGPLGSSQQRETVERYIATGVREGARLACGGGRPSHLERGFYFEPTVFADVDNSSTIAQEEIFGPVLSVIPADNEDQAVALANDSVFGIQASVFCNDVERVYRLARRLQSATVSHNGPNADFGIGFGGVKQSGIGRDGGRDGLLEFLEPKTVLINGFPAAAENAAPQEG